jgi:hypothetical protein
MRKKLLLLMLLFLVLFCQQAFSVTVVYPSGGSDAEMFAAKEVRRYIYLRTDQLLTVQGVTSLPAGELILVADDDDPMVQGLSGLINHTSNPGGFVIKTVNSGGRDILVITGYDPAATLHAAYRYAEHLGCGFDLAGDAVPDTKITLDITGFDEAAEPLLQTRGFLPFHAYYPGPDLYQTDDYIVFINQLAKMGMNLLHRHTYISQEPTEDGREPLNWMGLPSDSNPDGTVNWSYSSYWAHTHRPNWIWGTTTLGTDNYHAGAKDIFPRDFYGCDVFGTTSMPTDMAGYNTVFNNTGDMLNKAFTFANTIGVKTASGNQLGLNRFAPSDLLSRLGGSLDNTEIKDIYKGMFTRIMNTHPLDYFTVWHWEIYQHAARPWVCPAGCWAVSNQIHLMTPCPNHVRLHLNGKTHGGMNI